MVQTATSLRGGKWRLLDLLQSNRFWLVDAVPSSTFPFWVLGAPFMGFQTITMPEVTLEVDEVKQLNSMYKRYTYSGGSVGPITLTRGARVYDDSFMQWVQRAMRGIDMNPRNLLLIQFTNINVAEYAGGNIDLPVVIQAWEIAQFLPGRAWLLWDCIPTRYKAGSDLDAASGEVSIMELDLQPHAVTEFALLSVS
jgi:phage tail-like protein